MKSSYSELKTHIETKKPVILVTQIPVIPSIVEISKRFSLINKDFDTVIVYGDINELNENKIIVGKTLKISPDSILYFNSLIDVNDAFHDDNIVLLCEKSVSFSFEELGNFTKDMDNLYILPTPAKRPNKSYKKSKKKNIYKNENRPERNDNKYKNWRKKVFIRDNYTCALTGQKGGALEVHHIKRWSDCPSLRYSVSNGITLSKQAHKEIHGREAEYEEMFIRIAKKNLQINGGKMRKSKYKRTRRFSNPRAII